MANKIVTTFQEHDELLSANLKGSVVNFFVYRGEFKPRLVKVYRTIEKPNQEGATNKVIKTDIFGWTAVLIGDGKDPSVPRVGVFDPMKSLEGKRGRISIIGISYNFVRLLNVRYQEPRGGSGFNGAVRQERTAQHELIECDFVMERFEIFTG